MFHFIPGKCSGTEIAFVGGGLLTIIWSHILNMVSPVCLFSWHFHLTLHVQLMFHRGQPPVSEARKSYTRLLLICLQVCWLAHNVMVNYQKQPCLGLIFLASTSQYWALHLVMVVTIHWSWFLNYLSIRDKAIFWSSMNRGLIPTLPSVKMLFTSSFCQHFLNVRLLFFHVSSR